jgi:hypothetical protein
VATRFLGCGGVGRSPARHGSMRLCPAVATAVLARSGKGRQVCVGLPWPKGQVGQLRCWV